MSGTRSPGIYLGNLYYQGRLAGKATTTVNVDGSVIVAIKDDIFVPGQTEWKFSQSTSSDGSNAYVSTLISTTLAQYILQGSEVTFSNGSLTGKVNGAYDASSGTMTAIPYTFDGTLN